MLSLLGITPFPRPTPTPHARLLPLPRAVSDWSSSSATDDSCSGGEDEDFTNTTDPLALHSLEVLGESEEETVASYNAVNLSASDQESESFGGDGSDVDAAEEPVFPARRVSDRANKFEGNMQERSCV